MFEADLDLRYGIPSVMLVSVIIPAYRPNERLRACLDSIARQTVEDLEVILVDDGSPPGEVAALADTFSGDLQILRNEKSEGAAAARNRGLRAARGEYVQFLDQDDSLDPRKIERQLARNQSLGEGTVTLSALVRFSDGSDPAEGFFGCFEPDPRDARSAAIEMLGGEGRPRMIQTGRWLLPREFCLAIDGWDPRAITDEDQVFALRVLLASRAVVGVADSVAFYRIYPARDSLSGRRGHREIEARLYSADKMVRELRRDSPPDEAASVARVEAGLFRRQIPRAWPRYPDLAAECIRRVRSCGGAIGPLPDLAPADRRWEKLFGWRIALATRPLRRRLRHKLPGGRAAKAQSAFLPDEGEVPYRDTGTFAA